MSRKAVIIVAGGTGTRMNNPVAKQFLPLAGKPVIFHTLEAFARFDPSMQFIVVLFPALRSQWEQLKEQYGFDWPHLTVAGGAERFHSVANGLEVLADEVELVAVHDAVRPLIEPATIARCFDLAEKLGAAIPVIPVVDTIRISEEGGSRTLPRANLYAVQTPQCFQKKLLCTAYKTTYQPFFTDDASVVEHSGARVHTTEGERSNIKITSAEDLAVVNSLLAWKQGRS